jgi:DHA2 family multidrug resistance protein
MAPARARTNVFPKRTPLYLRASYPWLVTITVVLGSMMPWADAITMKAVLGMLPPERVGMAAGLINLLRQIGGMVGIAVLSTLLERREIYHKWILAQTQAFAPLGSEGYIDSMKDIYGRLGNVDSLAELKALITLDRMTSRTALINAFDDCFIIASLIFFLTIIPALFIRRPRPQ